MRGIKKNSFVQVEIRGNCDSNASILLNELRESPNICVQDNEQRGFME